MQLRYTHHDFLNYENLKYGTSTNVTFGSLRNVSPDSFPKKVPPKEPIGPACDESHERSKMVIPLDVFGPKSIRKGINGSDPKGPGSCLPPSLAGIQLHPIRLGSANLSPERAKTAAHSVSKSNLNDLVATVEELNELGEIASSVQKCEQRWVYVLADGIDLMNDEFVVYKDNLNHYCELMIPKQVPEEKRELGSRQTSTRGSEFGSNFRRVETSQSKRRNNNPWNTRKTLKRL